MKLIRSYPTGAIVLIIFIVLITMLAAQGKTDLGLQLLKGKSYRLEMAVEQKIKQTVEGKTKELTQALSMRYDFDIIETDKDGTMTVKVTYNLASFKQDGWMGKKEYDFSKPQENVHPFIELLSSANGQSFRIKLSPKGIVLKISGAEEMISKIMKKIDAPEGPAKEIKEQILREHFGESALKELIEKKIFWFYPEASVNTSESWKKQTVISSRYPMVIKSDCMLEKIEGSIAYIGVKSIIKPNTSPVKSGVETRTYNLKGKQSGRLEIARKTGFLTGGNLVQEFEGKVTIEDESAKSARKPFTVSAKKTIKFTGK